MSNHLHDAILLHLREHPEGVASGEIAQRFLKFTSPDQRLAHATVQSILGQNRRCSIDAQGLWHATAGSGVQRSLAKMPWAAVAVLPHPDPARKRPFHLSVWRVLPSPKLYISAWLDDPASLPQNERELLCSSFDRAWDAASRDTMLAGIAALLDQCMPIYLTSMHHSLLLRECRSIGESLTDESLTISRLLRGIGEPIPRPLTLESCHQAILGASLPACCASGNGKLLAECAAELFDRCMRQGIDDMEALLKREYEELAGIDFSGKKFTVQELANLPPACGVYAFMRNDGAYLYIGKSKNLQQRLVGYFSVTDESPAKLGRLRSEAYEFKIQRCGSELESLIYEHRLIKKHAPELNKQTEIRERKGTYRPIGDAIFLLPHIDEGKMMTVWVRQGQKSRLVPLDTRFERSEALINDLTAFFYTPKLSAEPGDFAEQEIISRWVRRHEANLPVVPVHRAASAEEICEAMKYAWIEAHEPRSSNRREVANGGW